MNRADLSGILKAFAPEFRRVLVLSAVANLLMLVPTLYMLQVYDRVVVSRNEVTLATVSGLALLAFTVLALVEWLRTRILVTAGMRMDRLLGSRVFDAACAASLSRVEAIRHPGQALGDLLQVRQFVTGNGIFGFMDLPWVPIYIAVMSLLHPMLGVASLCFAVLQAAVAWWGHRGAAGPAEAASQAQREENLFLQAKIRNLEVLHAMGMVGPLRSVWYGIHRQTLQSQIDAQSQSHRQVALSKFLRYVQQSGALAVGALLVIRGELSPGAMVAANVLMSRALAPIDMLVSTWKGLVMAREAMSRLAALLNATGTGGEGADAPLREPAVSALMSLAASPSAASTDIVVKDLTVLVPNRETPVLHGVDGVFKAASITVIMGPSGSGKSTLLRSILGLQAYQGQVLIGGRAPRGWSRAEQGRLVGYLPQDIGLFEATVAENIARLGAVESTQVIEAAKSVGLHETILRLPQGYDTPIAEHGGVLSGGQRQRLALARAVYGRPSVLLLDEPNSNLDEEGERELSRALDEARRRGATIVLVTHRPSVLSMADQLILLGDGRVLRAGSPADLLQPQAPARPAQATT